MIGIEEVPNGDRAMDNTRWPKRSIRTRAAAPKEIAETVAGEALLTISVLLPKLQAVRRVHVAPFELQSPRCQNCDE